MSGQKLVIGPSTVKTRLDIPVLCLGSQVASAEIDIIVAEYLCNVATIYSFGGVGGLPSKEGSLWNLPRILSTWTGLSLQPLKDL